MPALSPSQNGIRRGSERDFVAATGWWGSSGRRSMTFDTPEVERIEVASVATVLGLPLAAAQIEVDSHFRPGRQAIDQIELLVCRLEEEELRVRSLRIHLEDEFTHRKLL